MSAFVNPRTGVMATGILLTILPFCLTGSTLTTAVFVLIAAIGATGLNILTGYAGQVSLGHAFFMAVGAYSFVLLTELGGESVWWLLPAAVVAATIGCLVGPIALRLRGLYLAIVTMGLVFIGQHILFNSVDISGGPEGRIFPSLAIGGVDFATDYLKIGPLEIDANGLYYYLALIVFALVTLLAWNVRRSPTGRAMLAVKDRSEVARLAGIKVSRSKVLAFALSAFLGGLCGALYASYIGYAQPGQWDLHMSIQFVAVIVIGGLGSLAGPLLGAIVVFALPTVLNNVAGNLTDDIPTGALASLIYGVLIVIFLLTEPRGLVGIGRRVTQRLSRRSEDRTYDSGTGEPTRASAAIVKENVL